MQLKGFDKSRSLAGLHDCCDRLWSAHFDLACKRNNATGIGHWSLFHNGRGLFAWASLVAGYVSASFSKNG
jgi:hypothetical protein